MPKSRRERFAASLERHPNPALEEWRWSRETDGTVDARADATAWDLVTLRFGVEIGRNIADFLMDYRHQEHISESGVLRTFEDQRTLVILLDESELGRRARADKRHRDIELKQEGHLVVHISSSDLWQDPLGVSTEALRTLVDATRLEVEQSLAAFES